MLIGSDKVQSASEKSSKQGRFARCISSCGQLVVILIYEKRIDDKTR